MELISIVMLMMMTTAGAVRLKKRFEEIIPLVVLGIIVWLYVFYCFDLLLIGYCAIVLWCVVCIVWVCYSWMKDKNTVKQAIAQPGTVVWLLVISMIYLITINNKVVLWDELRLWGAYPKILYHTDKLQVTNASMLYDEMRCYMPGISLWTYYVIKPMWMFKESALFFAYGTYSASLLVSVCSRLRWDEWKKIPLFTVVVFLVPTFCYNSGFDYANFYYSLFVDPIIGITLAYFLYKVFDSGEDDKLFMGFFILSTCVLTILKSSGIAMSVIAIIGCFFVQKKSIGTRNALKGMFIAMVINLGCWGVWQAICTQYVAKNPVSFGLQQSINFPFFKTFVKELVDRPVIRWIHTSDIQVGHSFLIIFVIFLIAGVIITMTIEKTKQMKFCYVYSVLLVEILVFIIGLYITCTSGFNYSTPSFPRYTCTVLSSQVIFVAMVLLNLSIKNVNKNRYQRVYVLMILALFLVFPIRNPIEYNRGKEIIKDADKQADDLIMKLENSGVEETENVFLVCEGRGGEVVLYHHRIYFSTIGTVCRIKNHATMTEIAEKDASSNIYENKREAFNDFLSKEMCDYIYIDSVSVPLVEQYQEEFSDDIIPSSLWKIVDYSNYKKFVLLE